MTEDELRGDSPPNTPTPGEPATAEQSFSGAWETGGLQKQLQLSPPAALEGLSSSCGALHNPRVLVISGPSGVGKGTLVRLILQQWPRAFGFSVSHTTRPPRPYESQGKDYFFVNREEIARMQRNGEMLEHAEFSGNIYGTSLGEIERMWSRSQICLLEIEMVGVASVKRHPLSACTKFVFIRPPTFGALEKRLRGRQTETEEAVQKRLLRAKQELDIAESIQWDLVLTNDNVGDAWSTLREALIQWFQLPVLQDTSLGVS